MTVVFMGHGSQDILSGDGDQGEEYREKDGTIKRIESLEVRQSRDPKEENRRDDYQGGEIVGEKSFQIALFRASEPNVIEVTIARLIG